MINEVIYLDFFNSLVDGNKEHCTKIIKDLLSDKTDIKDIYSDLFQKSLYRIGKMWEQNRLSVAEEHSASRIVESLMSFCVYKIKNHKTNGHKVIISCIDKEYHDIGPKMVAQIFELNGWQTFFLGASTPTREIVKYVKEKNPEIIGLSFNLYLNVLRLREVLDKLKEVNPDLKIVLGGQGVESLKKDFFAGYKGIEKINSLHKLDEYLHNLN